MTRLTVPVRLWLAAALCVAPLGLTWSVIAQPGTTIPGDCGYSDGPFCVPDAYLPGATSVTLVGQAPVRVFLLAAAALFVVCAVRPRTDATRRLAQVATISAGIAAVLAAAHTATQVLGCALGAVVLIAPLVWTVDRFKRLPARRPAQ